MLIDAAPKTVLVVDPDPAISRVVRAGLSRDRQFTVTAAFHARDALAAALAAPFDIVLWALNQTGDGVTLARIRALCPSAALILMTTDDRLRPEPDNGPLDVAGVLVKPFGLDSLYGQVAASVFARPHGCVAIVAVGRQVTLVSAGGRTVTRIYSFDHSSARVIGAPRAVEAPDLAPGTVVVAEFPGCDALYRFRARLKRRVQTPVSAWELSLPLSIQRRQRRKHPRVQTNLPIRLQPLSVQPLLPQTLPDSIASALTDMVAVDGATENISLGGCLVVVPRAIPEGVQVSMTLRAGGTASLVLTGQVRRCVPRVHPAAADSDVYAVGIQFGELSKAARAQLSQLIGPIS
jgi:c-di-GMP-binding flagellar brake protein YcgR